MNSHLGNNLAFESGMWRQNNFFFQPGFQDLFSKIELSSASQNTFLEEEAPFGVVHMANFTTRF